MEAIEAEPVPLGLIRAAQYLCVAAFLAAFAAAGGEVWRYALLLRGRTEVLSGPLVVASDRLVAVAASSATLLALCAAAAVPPALVRLHGVAARRSDLGPSRAPASVLARLVVPGWNIYGLGVVIGEVDAMLASPRAGGRPRLSRLVVVLWGFWVADALLVLLTLGRAFGRSEQAMADTVELHVFLDVVGAVVALLCALLFRRFRRTLAGTGTGELRGWVVRPPAPTRGSGAIHRPDPDPGPGPADAAGQPAMVTTAPASADDGPLTNQVTVSASTSGDHPAAAAGPDPTTVTPMP